MPHRIGQATANASEKAVSAFVFSGMEPANASERAVSAFVFANASERAVSAFVFANASEKTAKTRVPEEDGEGRARDSEQGKLSAAIQQA